MITRQVILNLFLLTWKLIGFNLKTKTKKINKIIKNGFQKNCGLSQHKIDDWLTIVESKANFINK